MGFFALFKKTKKELWIHFPITISNGDFEGNETLCQSGLSNDLNWAINSLITSFFRVELDVFDCFLSALSLTASDSEEDPEPSELDSLEDCVPKIGFKKIIVKSKCFSYFCAQHATKFLRKSKPNKQENISFKEFFCWTFFSTRIKKFQIISVKFIHFIFTSFFGLEFLEIFMECYFKIFFYLSGLCLFSAPWNQFLLSFLHFQWWDLQSFPLLLWFLKYEIM